MKTLPQQSPLFSSPVVNTSKLLQETGSIGVWEVILDSGILSWSETTKKIHGVAPTFNPTVEEAISFYKEGFYRNKITADFNKAVTEGLEFDSEYIIVNPKGEEKWIRSIGVPVFAHSKCARVYGIFQDIDRQKRSDILLERNEKRFSQIFENAPNGIALISTEGEWIKVNARFSQILGYTEKELLEFNFKKLTHPEDLNNELENLNYLLKGKAENYQTEKKYLHKSGTNVWCLHSVSIERTLDHSPNYFIAQIIDISSLKRAQNKIESLLEETNRKNEKLLNFKHIVSHNLRSHTSNLEMLLDFLQQDIPSVKEIEIFGMVQEAFTNLQDTIKNLSEISSLENKNTSHYRNINVNQEIHRSIKNIKGLILEIGGSIDLDLESNLVAYVIPEYLRSSFLNILTNAIKYRKEDEKLSITIKSYTTETGVVISFTDNGLGIDLELHADKIFGMYKTFHRKENSKGLGLYLVKNQIEVMGGEVTVESEVNKGSTFKIFLKK